MKKLSTFIKPYLSLVFGVLLFLVYLNLLSKNANGGEGTVLAQGIIGVVVAVYYIFIGVIGSLIADKLNDTAKNVIDVVNMGLFPLFIFIDILLTVIGYYDAILPTGWIISVLSMLVSTAFVALYACTKFAKNDAFAKISSLFGIIFVLVLLLNILFNYRGLAIDLGDINIIMFVTYLAFSYMLFESIKAAPATTAAPADEEEESKE